MAAKRARSVNEIIGSVSPTLIDQVVLPNQTEARPTFENQWRSRVMIVCAQAASLVQSAIDKYRPSATNALCDAVTFAPAFCAFVLAGRSDMERDIYLNCLSASVADSLTKIKTHEIVRDEPDLLILQILSNAQKLIDACFREDAVVITPEKTFDDLDAKPVALIDMSQPASMGMTK